MEQADGIRSIGIHLDGRAAKARSPGSERPPTSLREAGSPYVQDASAKAALEPDPTGGAPHPVSVTALLVAPELLRHSG